MSSCDIPFTTSNISYILLLPSKMLTTDLLTFLLTLAICRGAFAPKNYTGMIRLKLNLQDRVVGGGGGEWLWGEMGNFVMPSNARTKNSNGRHQMGMEENK